MEGFDLPPNESEQDFKYLDRSNLAIQLGSIALAASRTVSALPCPPYYVRLRREATAR
ncbi:MAG: hypothetical protein AAF849_05290 [Bacteroidota bacterium]